MTWIVALSYLKSAWVWAKQHTGFLLLCLVGMFTGAKLLRRKDSQIATLNEAIVAQKHKTEIARLQGKAEELVKLDETSVARDRVLAADVERVELQITEHKRKLVALHNKEADVSKMTDAEVEEVFRASGL